MRKACSSQVPLAFQWLELDHAKELQTVSGLLAQHPKIAELVLQDLRKETKHETGACGMTTLSFFGAIRLAFVISDRSWQRQQGARRAIACGGQEPEPSTKSATYAYCFRSERGAGEIVYSG